MNYSFRSMIKRGKSRLRILWKVIRRAAVLFGIGIILNTNWGRTYSQHPEIISTKLFCHRVIDLVLVHGYLKIKTIMSKFFLSNVKMQLV